MDWKTSHERTSLVEGSLGKARKNQKSIWESVILGDGFRPDTLMRKCDDGKQMS